MTEAFGEISTAPPPALVEVLAHAQRLGFLGPGALEPHLSHSMRFAAVVATLRGSVPTESDRVVDLGSGGGLPGLVLAMAWPRVPICLVEGSTRRARFLRDAAETCGVAGWLEVDDRRAELVGRDPGFRGRASIVVARLFGGPAVTAECAAPLLRIDGVLVVSEPPEPVSPSRWPAEGLRTLGLEVVAPTVGQGQFAGFRLVELVDERFPRRVGVPTKRPLF